VARALKCRARVAVAPETGCSATRGVVRLVKGKEYNDSQARFCHKLVNVAVHLHSKAGEIAKLAGRSKTTITMNDLKIIATLLAPDDMEVREWRLVVLGSTGNGDDTDDEDDDQYIVEDDYVNADLHDLLESNMNSILKTRGVKVIFDGHKTAATMLRLCTSILQSLTHAVSSVWIGNRTVGTEFVPDEGYTRSNPMEYNPERSQWIHPFDVMGGNYYSYS
jgi:hypothetical protein